MIFEPPLTLKPLPETDTDLTSTFVLPVLFNVTSWLVVFPTATLPKLRAAGVTERRQQGWRLYQLDPPSLQSLRLC